MVPDEPSPMLALSELIPNDACPRVPAHPETETVKQRLVEAVLATEGNYPEKVVTTYAETLLRLWSVDGQPTAAAVLSDSLQGYFRDWPLSARLLRFIVTDIAYKVDLTDYLPAARRLVSRLGRVLHNIALSGAFPILLQKPRRGANELFQFHWKTHTLSIYPRTAARLHCSLVRRLNDGNSIQRLLTPLVRISVGFSRLSQDPLPPPMFRLDHDEAGIRRLYKQVCDIVAILPNIFAPGQPLVAKSTQPKYVSQYLAALNIAGVRFHGHSLIFPPHHRLTPPEIDRLDTDPAEEPGDPFAAYDDLARQETEEEEGLSEPPLPDDLPGLAAVPELEGLHPADVLRRREYFRQRAAMQYDLSPDDWAGLPLFDLALGYDALLGGAKHLSHLDLGGMALLFLYHLLLVTGRPWHWLLSARVGPMPAEPGDCPQPVLDADRFAFFFVPQSYPALGKRLRPPEANEEGEVDAEAQEEWRREWKAHVQLYDEVSVIRALPLDPSARLLAAVYLDLRRQALAAGPLHPNLRDAAADAGPLLVTREPNGLVRPLDDRDTAALVQQINKARRRQRPDAPLVTRPRLRHAAVFHLMACGLDRIVAHLVTGRHLPGLRAPLFYTLVCSDDLTASYHQAVAKLLEKLAQARPKSGGGPVPFPWEQAAPPDPKEPCPSVLYGALYHPRVDHIRAVVAALTANARRPPDADTLDPAVLDRARHNALTILTCYLLSLFAGLRVGEVAALRRGQIDFFDARLAQAMGILGLITIQAKSDRFYEEYRTIPIPPPLAPLLGRLLEQSAQASGLEAPNSSAFWFYRKSGAALPLQQRDLWRGIDATARAHNAGRDSGAPRWHSTRHFLRTFLYRRGVDEATINYILGHQSEGAEAGNAYHPSTLRAIFAAYQEATWALAEELELQLDGLCLADPAR